MTGPNRNKPDGRAARLVRDLHVHPVRRITRPGDAITTDRALALQPTIPQKRRNSTTVRMPCFFALRIIAFNVTSPTGVRSPSKKGKKTRSLNLAQARLLDGAESRQARLRHAGIEPDVAHDGGAIHTRNIASGALCPDKLSIHARTR